MLPVFLIDCKLEVPTTSSDSLLEWLAERKSIYLCLPVAIKDIIETTGEQADGEV